jgi:hypothetical protein
LPVILVIVSTAIACPLAGIRGMRIGKAQPQQWAKRKMAA